MHVRFMHVAGAMTVLASLAAGPPAIAQQGQTQTAISAGIAEAVQALDEIPRLKRLTPAVKQALVEFTVGNTLFVLAHEMGHVVINELGLPVLGREEDAADSFGAIWALQIRTAFSERVLVEAAKGWVYSARRDKKEGTALAFEDAHSLDLQRAYNVVCFMVGSDPVKFKDLAAEAKLPQERQKPCEREYKTTAWSWEFLLKPHRRAADQPKTTINVVYKDDAKYAVQARVLRNMRLLEIFAEAAADRFTWKEPFSFEARSCGEPNATWTFKTRTMTLCYELAEEFSQLYLDYGKKAPGKQRAVRGTR
jgi:hypothetical protein